jgi:hypothetical protein
MIDYKLIEVITALLAAPHLETGTISLANERIRAELSKETKPDMPLTPEEQAKKLIGDQVYNEWMNGKGGDA